MISIHSNVSSTSFQLFCEMLLLSVHQSDSDKLLFAGHRTLLEVFSYGEFVSVLNKTLSACQSCSHVMIVLNYFLCVNYFTVHHYAKYAHQMKIIAFIAIQSQWQSKNLQLTGNGQYKGPVNVIHVDVQLRQN